ncbi:MAG TPA: cupin domain-containing protein [Xanthobacteraceae bacterium]|nr:cupin domain-containing protein [Xanthobacteraceae bacterium]
MIYIRRRFLHIAGAALALPAIARICDAQPSQGGLKLNQLLRADLQRQGQMVQETMVNLLEMAPSASAPWHMHPGAQEIIFVVEGKLVVEVEGEGSREVTSGATALISAETPHLVRNASAQATARTLVIHSRADKETPFLVVLKKPA